MERNRFVDVLKGIFIIFVIVLHSAVSMTTRDTWLFPFWVNLAVPAFMLISGYVSALSEERRGISNLQDSYEPKRLLKKWIRFLSPFSIAFVAEWIVFRVFGLYTVGVREYGIFALLLDFLRGGKGQGSYYFPVMMQFVVLFPIIYYIIRKYALKGLAGCFVANGFFEVLKLAYGMGDYEYRLLVLRYIFVIAAGCYLAIGNIHKSWKTTSLAVGCLVAGALFIYLFSYTGYTPKIITFWQGTSFLTGLFLVPILGWLLCKVRVGFKPLEIVGKASFNIFLVQMIYFIFVEETCALIPNVGLHLVVSIVNCVAVGVLFYYLEHRLTQFVISKIK
ncbi:MAG: acyltransferase [Lachnospiraceae bacterium]|nr:acyltransferase [Lachnospiraceae bacterium]